MKFVVVSESVIEELLADVDYINTYAGVETGRRRLIGLQMSLQSLLAAAQDEDLLAAREVAATSRLEYNAARAALLEAMEERGHDE